MATIELFTSPTCPHCPPAKALVTATVQKMRAEGMKVEFASLDTSTPQGREKAAKYEIYAVPTAVVLGEKHSLLLEGISENGLREACLVADGKKELKR